MLLYSSVIFVIEKVLTPVDKINLGKSLDACLYFLEMYLPKICKQEPNSLF